MYKVAIVDDEPMVCRSLAEKVDWAKWNCIVCGTGANGLEGKELVRREQPDIVITDVKMPGMDGLELVDYIQRMQPHIATIIISGYNEFNYAREAIKYGVSDYLLKPIDKEEFEKTMQKVLQTLDNKREMNIQRQHAEKFIEELSPIAETKLLMDLMLNNDQQLKPVHVPIDVDPKFNKGQVVVYDILNAWEQGEGGNRRSLYQFAMNNILHEIFLNHKCEAHVMWIEDKCVVVAKFDASIPAAIAEKRVREALVEGAEKIGGYFKKRVYVGKGDFFNRIEGLHQSFKSALHALKNHLFWSREFAYEYEVKAELPPAKLDARIYQAIREGNEIETIIYYDHFMDTLRKQQNVDQVYSTCLELLIHLNNIAKDFELDYELPTLNQLKEHMYFKDFAGEMRTIVRSICQLIHKQKAFMNSPLIGKILIFLQEEYHRSDLSLQLVADEFQISLSHLSRLFKKETDSNFNDYLSFIRMEKAKKFLKEDYNLTIQEIANKVGYTDGKYFGQVFKKHFGVTPSEFKNIAYRGDV